MKTLLFKVSPLVKNLFFLIISSSCLSKVLNRVEMFSIILFFSLTFHWSILSCSSFDCSSTWSVSIEVVVLEIWLEYLESISFSWTFRSISHLLTSLFINSIWVFHLNAFPFIVLIIWRYSSAIFKAFSVEILVSNTV